jgi:Fe-S-cluster containining protein
MALVIDLPFIAQEALEKEEDNIAFRTFLKNLDISSSALDAIVHEIYDEVSAQIDCTQCANCCKLIRPILYDKDVDRFAKGLRLAPADLKKDHIVLHEEEPGKFLFNALPCPFLAGDSCGNYDARPQTCRSFPHLHKKGFRSRLLNVIFNYERCPIVYYVYEELKQELWYSDEFEVDDYLDDIF